MLDGRQIFLKEDTQMHLFPPLVKKTWKNPEEGSDNFQQLGGGSSSGRGSRFQQNEDGFRGSRFGNRYFRSRSRSRDRSDSGSRYYNDKQAGGRRGGSNVK